MQAGSLLAATHTFAYCADVWVELDLNGGAESHTSAKDASE